MIEMIVAHDENRGIGLNNELPWPYLKEDMAHFVNKTKGKTVVMGRKTADSIGKPLPNRRNIILTRDTSFTREGYEVVHDLAELNNCIVIGGSEIYKQMLPITDVLYVTEIPLDFLVDSFFPRYNHMFKLTSEKQVESKYCTLTFKEYQNWKIS